jgi:hypothetical protein
MDFSSLIIDHKHVMMEIILREVPLILTVTEMRHDRLKHFRVRLISVDVCYLIAWAKQIISVIGHRLICSCAFHDKAWIIDPGKDITFSVPIVQSCVIGRLKVHLIRAEQVFKLLYQKI